MTLQYAPYLAVWFTVGAILVGSHVWNAAVVLLNSRKPRSWGNRGFGRSPQEGQATAVRLPFVKTGLSSVLRKLGTTSGLVRSRTNAPPSSATTPSNAAT